jgi:hypothetical protein
VVVVLGDQEPLTQMEVLVEAAVVSWPGHLLLLKILIIR